MSNNLDLPHLVRVCEAATPGPWQCLYHSLIVKEGIREGFITRIAGKLTTVEQDAANAQFIATFNPSTVLALLRRLGEAEERVTELESLVRSGSDGK